MKRSIFSMALVVLFGLAAARMPERSAAQKTPDAPRIDPQAAAVFDGLDRTLDTVQSEAENIHVITALNEMRIYVSQLRAAATAAPCDGKELPALYVHSCIQDNVLIQRGEENPALLKRATSDLATKAAYAKKNTKFPFKPIMLSVTVAGGNDGKKPLAGFQILYLMTEDIISQIERTPSLKMEPYIPFGDLSAVTPVTQELVPGDYYLAAMSGDIRTRPKEYPVGPAATVDKGGNGTQKIEIPAPQERSIGTF